MNTARTPAGGDTVTPARRGFLSGGRLVDACTAVFIIGLLSWKIAQILQTSMPPPIPGEWWGVHSFSDYLTLLGARRFFEEGFISNYFSANISVGFPEFARGWVYYQVPLVVQNSAMFYTHYGSLDTLFAGILMSLGVVRLTDFYLIYTLGSFLSLGLWYVSSALLFNRVAASVSTAVVGTSIMFISVAETPSAESIAIQLALLTVFIFVLARHVLKQPVAKIAAYAVVWAACFLQANNNPQFIFLVPALIGGHFLVYGPRSRNSLYLFFGLCSAFVVGMACHLALNAWVLGGFQNMVADVAAAVQRRTTGFAMATEIGYRGFNIAGSPVYLENKLWNFMHLEFAGIAILVILLYWMIGRGSAADSSALKKQWYMVLTMLGGGLVFIVIFIQAAVTQPMDVLKVMLPGIGSLLGLTAIVAYGYFRRGSDGFPVKSAFSVLLAVILVPYFQHIATGGLVFMLSGTFTWFANLEQLTNVAMVTPMLLWAINGLWLWRWQLGMAASASSIGLVLLGGQPETALYVLLLGAVYAIYRVSLSPAVTRLKSIIYLGGAAVIGFGMALPQVIPFLELAGDSHNLHPAGGPMGMTGPAHPLLSPVIFFPTLHNLPTWLRAMPENGVWDYLGGYTGVLPLALLVACSALFCGGKGRKWRPLFILFIAFATLILLKNFGVPPFSWLGLLPLFDQAWSPRWAGPAWTLPSAVVTAIGIQVMMDTAEDTAAGSRIRDWLAMKSRKHIYIDLGIVAALTAAAFGLLAVYRGMLTSEQSRYFYPAIASGLVVGFLVLLFFLIWTAGYLRNGRALAALAIILVAEEWYAIPMGYDDATAFLRLIPFVFSLLAVLALLLDKREWAASVLGIAVLVSVGTDALAPKGLPQRFNPAAPAPYVNVLREADPTARVTAMHGVLAPNFASAVGIQDIRYVTSLTPMANHLFRMSYLHCELPFASASGSLWFTGDDFAIIERNGKGERVRGEYWRDVVQKLKYYSLGGVRYVISPAGDDWKARLNEASLEAGVTSLNLVYDREVLIWENRDALPRAWIARSAVYSSGRDDALRQVGSPSLNLRTTVILEERPGINLQVSASSQDTVVITEYLPNSVTIRAELGAPGMLVLSDLCYPGWSAAVDGTSVKIYRVDGVIRGVELPAGNHTVVFSYFPAGLGIGLVIAVFSIILAVTLAVCGCRKPRLS